MPTRFELVINLKTESIWSRPQVAFLDGAVRPEPCHLRALFHDMTGAFDQSDQHVEGAAADMNQLTVVEQESLPRRQMERAKADPCSAGARLCAGMSVLPTRAREFANADPCVAG